MDGCFRIFRTMIKWIMRIQLIERNVGQQTGQVANQMRASTIKPDNLRQMPQTHVVERIDSFRFSPDPHTWVTIYMKPHTYICTYTHSHPNTAPTSINQSSHPSINQLILSVNTYVMYYFFNFQQHQWCSRQIFVFLIIILFYN